LHHLLTGRDPGAAAPFSFPPVEQLSQDCNPRFAELIDDALEYDVVLRIQSAQEFKRRLSRIRDRDQRAKASVPSAISAGASLTPTLRLESNASQPAATPFARGQEVPTEPVRAKVTRVAEFNTLGAYESWLEHEGRSAEILSVATTKRWGFVFGFLGHAKQYTVTYQVAPDPIQPKSQSLSFFLALAILILIAFVAFLIASLSK